MSTVRRIIYINPIEPAPLSLRAPASMETRIEATMLRQNGAPYNQDPAAQLQLTARTDARTTTYAMPSTDVVNGKMRAVIPAGDLDDINGYRLRVLGTIDQQPALIAMGSLRLVEAAGMEAQPEDVVDSINLLFAYNVDAAVIVEIWHDAGKSSPFDLDATTITALVLSGQGGTRLASFAVAENDNQAILTMPASTVNTLPAACWWTLTASSAAGSQLLAQGNLTITGTPTP
jgi:hypothetical protein